MLLGNEMSFKMLAHIIRILLPLVYSNTLQCITVSNFTHILFQLPRNNLFLFSFCPVETLLVFLNNSFAVVSGVTHSESSCMKCPRYEPTPRAKGSLKAEELKYGTTLKNVCENNTFSPNILSLIGITQSS